MDEVVKSTPADVASGVAKEAGAGQTFIKDATVGPQITNDVSDFVKPSEPVVPHVPEVGLHAAAESTPVQAEDSLPMTEKQAEQILKEGSKSGLNLHEIQEGEYVEDSKPFLAALVEKLYQRFRVFGKFVSNKK